MSSASSFVCAPTAVREPLLTGGRVDLVISTFTYTADRDTRIDFSRAYYKATGRLLVKNNSPIQSLNDIRGRKVATTPGSIYDRWMRRCFPTTEVLAVESVTAAVIAFNQGRADAVMFDDTSLALQAATDPNAKLTDDLFLEAPYGIGIKQGNVAAEALGRRAAQPDEAEGHLPCRSSGTTSRRGSCRRSPGTSCGRTTRSRIGRHRCPASTPFVRRADRTLERNGKWPPRAATSLVSRCSLAVTYDLWAFVSENWEELLDGLLNTLKVSAIAVVGAFVIGVVLGAARAHRIPVVSQLTAVYVEIVRNTPILVQIFLIFFALPQFGITLNQFTVAWLSVMIWGGAFNSENFRAGFEAVPYRYREAGYALGFGPRATFLNVTLPIGGRIALPSSINTYISVDQEHVADVRDRLPRADDDGAQHQRAVAGDARGAHGSRRRLPDARLVALGRDSHARVAACAPGELDDEPARLGRAGRALHPGGGAAGDPARVRDRGRRQRA